MNNDAAKDSRDLLQLEFWKLVLEVFKQKNGKLFASARPSADSRLNSDSVIDSCFFSLLFGDEEIGIEFNMERPVAGENRFIYDELRRQTAPIEEQFKAELNWNRTLKRRNSRIHYKLAINAYNREQWHFMVDWLTTNMTNLENTLGPLLPSINERLTGAAAPTQAPTNISLQNAIDQIFAVAAHLPPPTTPLKSAAAATQANKTNQVELRKELWTRLLPAFIEKGITLYSRISPSTTRTLNAGSGLGSCPYKLGILDDRLTILFNMERSNAEENKFIFDHLHRHKIKIESAFGDQFEWHRLDDAKASRIEYKFETEAFNEAKWSTLIDEHINWYAEHITRLDKVLQPLLATIKAQL